MSVNAPTVPWQPRSSRLGGVALALALLAAVGATLLSAVSAFPASIGAMARAVEISPVGLENFSNDQLLALLTPYRTQVLWAEIGFWAGTVLGIWALAQGIVAIATGRGRGPGVAAVIVAALGPVIFAVVVVTTIFTGIAAGSAVAG